MQLTEELMEHLKFHFHYHVHLKLQMITHLYKINKLVYLSAVGVPSDKSEAYK